MIGETVTLHKFDIKPGKVSRATHIPGEGLHQNMEKIIVRSTRWQVAQKAGKGQVVLKNRRGKTRLARASFVRHLLKQA